MGADVQLEVAGRVRAEGALTARGGSRNRSAASRVRLCSEDKFEVPVVGCDETDGRMKRSAQSLPAGTPDDGWGGCAPGNAAMPHEWEGAAES